MALPTNETSDACGTTISWMASLSAVTLASAAGHAASITRATVDGFLDKRVVGGGSRGWVGGFNT